MCKMAALHAAHSSKYILPVTGFTRMPAGCAVLSTRGGECVKSLGFKTMHTLQLLQSPLWCTLSLEDGTGTWAPHTVISGRKGIVKRRSQGGSCVRVQAIGRVASKLNVLKSKERMLHTSLWCDFMSRDRLRVAEFERVVYGTRLGGESLGVAQNTASNSGRQLSGKNCLFTMSSQNLRCKFRAWWYGQQSLSRKVEVQCRSEGILQGPNHLLLNLKETC